MSKVTRYIKKPAETQDYNIDFSAYLEYHNDLAGTISVSATTGLNVVSSSLTGSVVTVFVSGGTSGGTYKVSAILTTQGGRIKQGDFYVRVKN